MKKLQFLSFLFLIVVFGSGTAAANLITNGDFETGDLTGWSTNGSVEVREAGLFADLQGMDDYFALLGLDTSDGNSTLRQDIEIVGYTELAISFDWAFDYWDNSYSADDTFISFVRQDGAPARRITLNDLETNGGFWNPDLGIAYGHYSEIIDISAYVTPEARVIFRLVEESDSAWYSGTASIVGIDNVSVSGAPVPEPATMILMGIGLVGLAGASRKKLFKK